MILHIVVNKSIEFDTDTWRDYFRTTDTDDEIREQLDNDNGQMVYLAGDVFGWTNKSVFILHNGETNP